MRVVRKKPGHAFELLHVDKVHFGAWLNAQVPKEERVVEHVQGLPLDIYYNTRSPGQTNDDASVLLVKQSKTGIALMPRGPVVFVGFDQSGISDKDFEELQQRIR